MSMSSKLIQLFASESSETFLAILIVKISPLMKNVNAPGTFIEEYTVYLCNGQILEKACHITIMVMSTHPVGILPTVATSNLDSNLAPYEVAVPMMI